MPGFHDKINPLPDALTLISAYIGNVDIRQLSPILDEEIPMNTAVINKSVLSFQSFPAFALADYQTTSQENAPSRRCTWEFIDENELADEMTESLPNPVSNPSAPDVDPEDFEKIYQWFLS